MRHDTNSKARFGRLLLTSLLAVDMLLSGTTAVSAHDETHADSVSVEPVSVDAEDDVAKFRVTNDGDRAVTVVYKVNGTDTEDSVTLEADSTETFTVPTDYDGTVDVAVCIDGEIVATASSNDVRDDLGAPNADADEILASAESTDGHDDLAAFAIDNNDEVPATLTYKVLGTGECETLRLDGNDEERIVVSTGDDEHVTIGLYYKGELIDVKTNAERTTDLGTENPKDCGCAEE